ncbi:hypothetical protein [Kitasatospora sp. NPDC005748]|uniref:hypothetical protein n=1 Tax=Kitasatospora sp. NPDC005748 TaxID=3157063 RepID=UPI0033DD7493
MGDGQERWRAAQAVQLLVWVASLLPPEAHRRAIAELGGAEHVAAEAARVRGPGHRPARTDSGPVAAGTGGPTAGLRAARSVLECDAVLAAAPVDWPALAAAHRREPFERRQRRALIARRDCPDAFTAELLTPWEPAVANRLVARQQELPPWAWRPGLARIGELRPSLLRHVLTGENAADLLHATPRVDLLVAAVDGYDHNHRQVHGFWEAVGVALRAGTGADPRAWRTAAERFPGHRGSLRGLLRGLGRPAAGAAGRPDLRVLVQAPPEVLAALVGRLGDDELAAMAEHPLRRLRTREYFTWTVLDRLHRAGVPPRALFARWALGVYGNGDATAIRAWLHGLDDRLDQFIDHLAHTDAELRRLLAERRPPEPPAADLPARLRRCAGPVEAQAVLDGSRHACGGPPWAELVRAHARTPLPEPVLCVLADRAGFPDELARALPRERLTRLAPHGPATARAALADLRTTSTASDLIERVRRAAVLDDRELLAAIRPAREALRHGHHLPPQAPGRDAWAARCAELVGRAAEAAGPGFWRTAAELLPGHDGSLPEFLAAVGSPARA